MQSDARRMFSDEERKEVMRYLNTGKMNDCASQILYEIQKNKAEKTSALIDEKTEV